MVADNQDQVKALTYQNAQLEKLLIQAREQLGEMRQQLLDLSQPPLQYAVFLGWVGELAEVSLQGRRFQVAVADDIKFSLQPGQEVLVNAMNSVVKTAGEVRGGQIAIVRENLADNRLLVVSRGEDEKVVTKATSLTQVAIQEGDSVVIEPASSVAIEKIDRTGIESLLLEEIPDVTYDQIGGLSDQISRIHDALELPLKFPELYAEHQLQAPRGMLLYGPPGCGKTLIAKAVANSLAQAVGADRSFFLSVKGPELLNKYVGETERFIRTIFERARSQASSGAPVVIFFDEMDALFRARGSGVSSDMETTVVPQLLTELDGVEALGNVIIIGASNREDMIDPAILRPGRLDVKIEIARPDLTAAKDIFARYLTIDLPLRTERAGAEFLTDLIKDIAEYLFTAPDIDHFVSGAMVRNIVDRAKTAAIKSAIAGAEKGISLAHLRLAVDAELAEARAVAAKEIK